METVSNDPFVPMSADEPAGARHAVRDSLLLTAELRENGGDPVSVRVRNLSAGGLMAEHRTRNATGTVVAVTLRGIGTVSGNIAWVADGRIGIAFDQPIDPMLARKPVGRQTARIRASSDAIFPKR